MLIADYSAGYLTGAQLRAAGFAGSVRYVGTQGRTKNAPASEVQSQRAAGLWVAAVYENVTTDWAGGYSAGVANARKALADPAVRAMAPGCPIFVAADQHLTASQLAPWRQYVLGAKSVLGPRCGAYGFSEAIDRVADLGLWYWQCGSRSVVRGVTHLYQRNTGTRSVAGIACDINDVMRPLTAVAGTQMAVEPPYVGMDDEMFFVCEGWDEKQPKVQLWAMYSGGVLTGMSADDVASFKKSFWNGKELWITASRMHELSQKSNQLVTGKAAA